MDYKAMTVEELQTRQTELAAEIDGLSTVEEVNERSAEFDVIKAELEARAAAEAKKAEIRETVAAGSGVVIEKIEKEEVRKMFTPETAEYRSAYLKTLMGRELTAEERSNTGMDSGSGSGGYAIPTVTLNKIIENMVQIAPVIAEVDVMHIPGNITIAVEGTRNAASIHTESSSITAQDDTLIRVQLGGYEIVKLVPISAKLDAMSIDAFEDWLINNLSRSIAEVIENYIINGTGSSQPKGIDYSATWVDGTNAVDFASAAPTVAEIEELIGLQNAAYITNAKFLMNWGTFWNQIHALRDDKKEQVVLRENGTYYIFGFPVVFSSKVDNGDIFFGDFRECVKANFAQDVVVESSRISGFKTNTIDYRGTCIFDCTTVAGRVVKGAATL